MTTITIIISLRYIIAFIKVGAKKSVAISGNGAFSPIKTRIDIISDLNNT